MPSNPFAQRSGGVAGQPVKAKPIASAPPLGGANTTTKKKSDNRGNRIASALGRAGAAVIGDQAHPFAQIGNLIAGEAEQDIFSSTLSDLLEGKNISDVDTRGLDPDQIERALKLQKEGQATSLGKNKELLSQLEQIANMDLPENVRIQMTNQAYAAAGIDPNWQAGGEEVGKSLKSETEKRKELIKAQGEEDRFEQYQGSQQDLELIREKGGIDAAIAESNREGQLDVAVTAATFRLLGIQLDVAGQIKANKARFGDDPMMGVKLNAVMQQMVNLNRFETQPLTPAESTAEFVRLLKSFGLEEFAEGLEKTAGTVTPPDQFKFYAEGAGVEVPAVEGEKEAPLKKAPAKKEEKKEPKGDSNRGGKKKEKATGIAPGLRGESTIKKPARRERGSRFN
ncbi:hypothetical protein HN911_11715 [Candidatus Bathyarchaeota archaeon]|jgi:hypothetical protein|nr:hypothetical protein [Candidatus Bathyarchaeota archaeon]